MKYRAIVAFVLLVSAALPAGANEFSGSPVRSGDGTALGSATGLATPAERYQQFAQRTPSVPPAPQCDVTQRGTGTWKDGDIIPTGSVTGSCSQTFECVAKPEGNQRPNAACGFTVQHTADLKRTGQCSDQKCTKCVHEPIKDKCEWFLKK
jgi:hypothetical protein